VAAGLGLLCWGFGALLSIGYTTFWIYTLIEAVTKEPSEGNDKIIWILVILFAFGVGPLIYWFVRRPQRIAQYGQ
jgi:membrane protein DedA with SNARE-associated domain